MLRILSGLFWTVIVVTCPVFFLGALLVWAVTAPFDRRKVALHLYSCAWAVFYVRSTRSGGCVPPAAGGCPGAAPR